MIKFAMCLLPCLLWGSLFGANKQPENAIDDQGDSITFFAEAHAIWPVGRQLEKNISIGFRGFLEIQDVQKTTLEITGSSLYRVYLNGHFIGHGPARAAHGYYRVDTWELQDKLHPGTNILVIEVAGYNVNSYYLLDQSSFVQAEVLSNDEVQLATGSESKGFQATLIEERIQKVPRYSFQRPFIECYTLSPDAYNWRVDKSASIDVLNCEKVANKKLLPRGVKQSDFEKRTPVQLHSKGLVEEDRRVKRYWKDRAVKNIGDKLGGFPEDELTMNPAIDLQKIKNRNQTIQERPYEASAELNFPENSYMIFDFGLNNTGFIGADISCNKAGRLYFIFDEILSNNDVDFKRLSCINAITYDLEPGSYSIESFEPYTLKYLKIIMVGGESEVNNIYLREYVNSDIEQASLISSDAQLNQIYKAGVETFKQNAVDLFMDCPSRERAGWLCDSYFTARVAADLSGNTRIEKNLFENYLLPEKFDHLPEGMLPMCYPADHYDGVFIPNWAMWFVIQLQEYLYRSNDREMVEALQPKVMQLFNYFEKYANNDGLLEKLDNWIFVEWSAANSFVQDVNYPTNMLYSAALEAASSMYDIPELQDKADHIRKEIRSQSFDGQFFVDNAIRHKNGKLEPTSNVTEVCQYYAFYFNVATPETYGPLWETLVQHFGPERKNDNKFPDVHFANSFPGNYLRLELLSRNEKASNLLDESKGFFSYMAERTGTLWENISTSASCNHGFASHTVHVLYRDVLGIYNVDVMGKKITLQFSDLDLSSCRGQIPVGDELVVLQWERDGDSILYHIEVPTQYKIEIKNLSGLELVAQ